MNFGKRKEQIEPKIEVHESVLYAIKVLENVNEKLYSIEPFTTNESSEIRRNCLTIKKLLHQAFNPKFYNGF